MAVDLELAAMAKVSEALNGLDETAIARVIKWASDRHGGRSLHGNNGGARQHNDRAGKAGEFAEIASLFDAASPSTEAEGVLVVCYWLQVVQGIESLEAQQVNTQLKHMGHGASSITRAFGDLIDRKPHLVMQTYKSGAGKQARKKYKMTTAGIRKVEEMLGKDASRSE